MEKTLNKADSIININGKLYRLLDIDETSGDHPIFNAVPLDEEDEDESMDEYMFGLLNSDVKYLIWEIASSCSGVTDMDYGELDFLLDNVCNTLCIGKEFAIDRIGEKNLIHGYLTDGKEYTSINESQLAYLCSQSTIETAQKFGKFLIANSAEIREAVNSMK